MSKSNCNCSHGVTNTDDRVKDVPGEWFYYTDCNGDDIQMIIREIKDPLFTPLAYIGSRLGFTSGSLILRRFFALLNINNLPVQDGTLDAISGNANFQQGIVDSPIPIQQLGDELWGAADLYLPPASDAVPLSIYPSHILLRKALLRAQRTHTKINIRLTGPATDLALDLKANSDLPLSMVINSIRVFGGAVDVSGNLFSVQTNKLAEYNIYLDPQAFLNVMAIADKHKIQFDCLCLDATNYCPITPEYFYSSLLPSTFVTTEGKAIGQFLDNVREAFGNDAFFNVAGVPGGGYYRWDAHSSRLDEITAWECNHYTVETTPLVSYSGWLHRSDTDNGYPMRVAMSLDCALFQSRWKPIFDKPITYDNKAISIASEPLTFNHCKIKDDHKKKDCCKDCRGH